MEKKVGRLRIIVMSLFVVAAMVFGCVRLMTIQIVQGEDYRALSEQTSVGRQEIRAARGEIVDANLTPLAANKVGYNIVADKAFLPEARQNDIILRVTRILESEGDDWEDSLPISAGEPYTFDEARPDDVAKMQERLNQQKYSTAENCMDAMIDQFEIAGTYTPQEQRVIAGVRYEMLARDFAVSIPYVLARDVSMNSVSKLKELSFDLQGIDVEEEAVRFYEDGDIAPHVLGTIGAIDADEYAANKDKGYKLNDVYGKSGIEYWGEINGILRGQSGQRTIVQDASGKAISTEVTQPAVPGNTIALTLDANFQAKVQQIMADHIAWLKSPANKQGRGGTVEGGAAVVLDAKTGAVLAMVNYPNYDINDYLNNYLTVANAQYGPLNNRATTGLYRPGSTFKTVTSAAALTHGDITANTLITATRQYHYLDIVMGDTAPPGQYNVVGALEVSSNSFFYEVGRLIGIDAMVNMAHRFGLGAETGLEIGGATGRIASPDYFDTIGQDWTPGQVLQAAIGQSETGVTVTQMAGQALTLANNGVRYQTHLVKGVYSYDRQTLISETQPTVVETIDNTNGAFDTIRQGMIKVAAYNFPAEHSLQDFPFQVAIKTGSPQITKELTSSAVIGYAPANDPQIAFAAFLEKGEYAKYMVRDIVNAYFFNGTFGQEAQTTTTVSP